MEAAAEHLLDEERDECDALSSSELQKLKLFERQVFYTQFQTRYTSNNSTIIILRYTHFTTIACIARQDGADVLLRLEARCKLSSTAAHHDRGVDLLP